MRFSFLSSPLCLLLLLSGCTEDTPPSSLRHQAQSVNVTLPAHFTDSRLVGGISAPTSMTVAPDGRIFVCEQGGRLRVIQDGGLLPEPFITLSVDSNGERGLLGAALDPDFPAQPFVYIYYTATSPTVHNRLSRFTANGNRAVAGSERVLLELDPLSSATNHNGGALHFGIDGKLYVGVGDNGRGVNAQTLANLHGKLLRLGKDGSLPSDNPFFGTAQGNRRAIWALGLRNPFSFAVQPGTGRIFINDVGQNVWEEINDSVAGANHGWPVTEGPTNDPRFRGPLYAYQHDSGEVRGCAIAGGAFYNPSRPQFPQEYVGGYFFADYCSGWIRMLAPGTSTPILFAEGPDAPVDLDVGPDGSLYYLDRNKGEIHRIRYVGAGELPVIATPPANQSVAAGQSATFQVSATGAAPLSYQWQRNGVNLSATTSPNLTLQAVKPEDSGARFRVRVSNAAGSVLSSEAMLTVIQGTAPVATVLSPPEGTLYSAGSSITFEGRGTDAEDGTLPASAFTWRVDFHHEDHVHPFLPSTSGQTRGTFTVPDEGETAADVWFRIHLQVSDSDGNTHAVFRDMNPRKVQLGLATEPAGLRVTLDGQPQSTPVSVLGVVGMMRAVGAVSPQELDGVTYVFDHWSDGGAATHDIRTPQADTLYTAVFRPQSAATGLQAEYFGAPDLTVPKFTRIDPTVDFRWAAAAPDTSMAPELFSVRWSGSVVPEKSGTFTFYTQSNDGVRLWVNGQLLIDNWTVHLHKEDLGTIALQAGRAYSLRMEFFENKGLATARLLWSIPGLKKQIIPTANLRPVPPAEGP